MVLIDFGEIKMEFSEDLIVEVWELLSNIVPDEVIVRAMEEFLRSEERGLIFQESKPPAGFEPATW